MPVALTQIRDILLPGLLEIQVGYNIAYTDWRGVFGTTESGLFVPSTPAIIRNLTLPEAVAVGAAAAIIKNPVVTRRFWQGWFK